MSADRRMIVILAVMSPAWLISKVLRGNGFRRRRCDQVGALIGNWLLPRFNIHLERAYGDDLEAAVARCPSGYSAARQAFERMGGR